MTPELTMLACTLVLALLQILLPALLRTLETGPQYNMGTRDSAGPPVGKVTGRLQRAQANLFETLPLFATAVLIVHVTAQESALTLYGAALYLAARVLYLPLYAFGIPVVRTLVWCVSVAGLLMLYWAILFAS
ncbi:MAPEG family protein [Janthinobacterium sp. GW458P]|uniref:MAPEG family protein n=1 Tax=Janthinobacterium sp. GW458P TaxID=1981504 RepID=UPI000A326715|nr:MAPEG family protein [Janthinobacterium sp. GW458P]MBE3023206.1 MAPEG family protein [Janthinobacterium sp. GW458P]